MPRANLYHLPGYVWHITQRCHRRQFLLKFARDRRAWIGWLYEARRRFGICVLDYQVTCNHVHLLAWDRGGEIARSMQLIGGSTGQAYNRRKRRRGAFWEDSYHATAIDSEEHLVRCLAYIDLNMVRAGAVSHPKEWQESGYREIQHAPQRYRIIDRRALCELVGVADGRLASAQNGWIESQLGRGDLGREPEWSEALAVGRRSFVEGVQDVLGASALHRRVEDLDGVSILRDGEEEYVPRSGAKMITLSSTGSFDSGE